jgi:Ser/Thr protein kinase RdoA (MazF antagonist)
MNAPAGGEGAGSLGPDDPSGSEGSLRDDWVRDLVGTFLPGARDVAVSRLPGGLSGAVVYRCDVDGRGYALKRWPEGTAAARVDEVHDVLRRARKRLGLVPELVPSLFGSTRLSWDSGHFELASWVPGVAVGDGGEDRGTIVEAVRRGAAAIGAFHEATRCWGEGESLPPAVLRRLGRIAELQRRLPEALARGQSPTPMIAMAAEWLRRHGNVRLKEAAARLEPWAARMAPVQVVLRDVHPQHILFDEGVVSGIVDFDALGKDAIATDLARWVGGFLGDCGRGLVVLGGDSEPSEDSQSLWEAAVSGYSAVRSVPQSVVDLAVDIAEASWVILLANWVVWAHLGERDFSGLWPVVDRRVREIMLKMEAGTFGTGGSR